MPRGPMGHGAMQPKKLKTSRELSKDYLLI